MGICETTWPLWAAFDPAGWWDVLSGRERLLFSSLALVFALLVGAFIIYLTDRWRRRDTTSTVGDANEQLASFRELYERGELSSDEFGRIREKLSGKLRQEMAKKASSEQAAQTPPSDGPPAQDKPPTPPEEPESPR
jgi:uncharacterized membrane protein